VLETSWLMEEKDRGAHYFAAHRNGGSCGE